jgi:hypothetical protein
MKIAVRLFPFVCLQQRFPALLNSSGKAVSPPFILTRSTIATASCRQWDKPVEQPDVINTTAKVKRNKLLM